jgi:hypothetical protein
MRRDPGSGGMVLLILLLLMSSAGLGVAYYMGYLDQFIKKEEKDEDEDEDEDKDEDDQAAAPAAPDASAFPTDIPNLSGRYTTDSFDETSRKWGDISGEGNDVTTRKGDIKKTDTYVYGGTGAGLKFPVDVWGDGGVYTMFWVARFNGSTKGRIFDGADSNWLSGFHYEPSGEVIRTGVAHHGDWLTEMGNSFGDHTWIQGTDLPNKFRVFGKSRVTDSSVYGTTSQITINMGQYASSHSSDWAVKEVIFYNRILSPGEIEKVETYLFKKYFPPLPEDISVAKGRLGEASDDPLLFIDDPRGVPFGYGTQEFCRQQAKTLGYPIWGHRTNEADNENNKNVKSKCFYYPEGTDFTEFEEDEENEKYTVGCTNLDRDIYMGCVEEE